MKKEYISPEFDLVKFNFGRILSGDDIDGDHIHHSVPQDIAEGGGELD